MNDQKPTKQMSRLSIVLFGFFFLYLAISEGNMSGNSIILFLLGVCLLVYGVITTKAIRKYLLKRAGIIEVDLEEHKDLE